MREIVAIVILSQHTCTEYQSQQWLQYYLQHRTKAIKLIQHNSNMSRLTRKMLKKYILSLNDQQFIEYLNQQGLLYNDNA
jgi:hypothetical protein